LIALSLVTFDDHFCFRFSGETIRLPTIAEPTKEEVAHWHGVYIRKLTSLFDRHKQRFGYGGRELVLL
jgi:2-acylglycerol O-acyltransferase 2